MPILDKERYLGDGVYASWDGWQIKLRAPREGGDHVVFLEPALQAAVVRFIAAVKRGEIPLSPAPPIEIITIERGS